MKNKYAYAFAEQYLLDFKFWVEGTEIALFDDYFVNLDTIVFCVDNNIPFKIFDVWYTTQLECKLHGYPVITIQNFIYEN